MQTYKATDKTRKRVLPAEREFCLLCPDKSSKVYAHDTAATAEESSLRVMPGLMPGPTAENRPWELVGAR